jgi:hypothetical protein
MLFVGVTISSDAEIKPRMRLATAPLRGLCGCLRRRAEVALLHLHALRFLEDGFAAAVLAVEREAQVELARHGLVAAMRC